MVVKDRGRGIVAPSPNRIGDIIKTETEPFNDEGKEKPVSRVGEESAIVYSVEPVNGGEEIASPPVIAGVKQLAKGHRYLLGYKGDQLLDTWAAANVQDAWRKWRDGFGEPLLTVDLKNWQLVEVSPDDDLAGYVVIVGPPGDDRPAYPELNDFGSLAVTNIDLGWGARRSAEVRGYLTSLRELQLDTKKTDTVAGVQLAEHEIRDNPIGLLQQLCIGFYKQTLTPISVSVRADAGPAMRSLNEVSEELGSLAKRSSPSIFKAYLAGSLIITVLLVAGLLAGGYFLGYLP